LPQNQGTGKEEGKKGTDHVDHFVNRGTKKEGGGRGGGNIYPFNQVLLHTERGGGKEKGKKDVAVAAPSMAGKGGERRKEPPYQVQFALMKTEGGKRREIHFDQTKKTRKERRTGGRDGRSRGKKKGKKGARCHR